MDVQKYRADYLIGNLFHNFSFTKILFFLSPLFSHMLAIFIALAAITIIIVILRVVVSSILYFLEKSVFLEITPPAFTQKTAYTTQQLFSVLHTIGSQRTVFERLIGKRVIFSFEIVSTREEGIRYIVRTTLDRVQTIEQILLSYLPQVKVKQIDEYLPSQIKEKSKVIEFRLAKHYAYPLAKQDLLNEHDPVAYITGMMTKLKPGELIALQIVVSPVKPKEVAMLSQKILHNEHVLRFLDSPHFPWYAQPIIMIFSLFGKVFQFVGWVINDFSLTKEDRLAQRQMTYFNQMTASHIKPARTLSTFEQEAVTSIQAKIAQPLFETTIRALILLKSKSEQTERVRGITASFSPFTVPGYQSLRKLINVSFINTLREFTFQKRQLSFLSNRTDSLLSSSELADLYHFPFMQVTQTENIVKVYSKELPAPLSLKKDTKNLDIIFAKNTYGEQATMIGLTQEERRRHMYIIGATGTGKSTLILSMVNQDLQHGKGIGVIDPHGELAETILNLIPEDRKDDLIYVNPDDLQYPVGINLMELTPGLSEEDSLREKEFIAESVISLFRKVFASDMKGNPHRIEYILRNTIHTAFTVENPTLFTIFELLNNPVYQRKVVAKLQDQHLKDFWKYEYGKAGDYQKVKMVSPVTARIGRFLFSPSAKRILEQTKSTISFDEILNGKILICNLAKGKLGEDTSQVLGIMILNKLQLAALKRARVDAKERKDFSLYVDEFQHFATKSFVEMLSESRKYKLNLIIAEQSTSQQDDKDLVHIILANVGTVVCFKTANPQDERLMLPQFEPYISQGEIYNLPAFHFYMKVSALHPEEPFSGETMLLNVLEDKAKLQKLIEASRINYAHKYEAKAQVVTDEEVDEKENTPKSSASKGNFPKRKKQ